MYVNDEFQSMDVYISKDLSLKAKADPETIVLSFGEPDFGPPAYMREKICSEALNYETFIDATSRYESPRGYLSLLKTSAI